MPGAVAYDKGPGPVQPQHAFEFAQHDASIVDRVVDYATFKRTQGNLRKAKAAARRILRKEFGSSECWSGVFTDAAAAAPGGDGGDRAARAAMAADTLTRVGVQPAGGGAAAGK